MTLAENAHDKHVLTRIAEINGFGSGADLIAQHGVSQEIPGGGMARDLYSLFEAVFSIETVLHDHVTFQREDVDIPASLSQGPIKPLRSEHMVQYGFANGKPGFSPVPGTVDHHRTSFFS